MARVDEVEPIVAASPADSVIHGDVFRDNVLWHDDGRLSAIVDFESASRGNTGFDLMVTMLAWCFGDHLDQALARALVRGYARERVVERAFLLGCYQQARAAALRFAVTRITDYELRPRGVVVFKDYRRFMARLRAIEAIAEADFPQWIRV